MPKVLISTVPFATRNGLPLTMLEEAGIEYLINPLNKKFTEDELADLIPDFDVLVAGTEPITAKVLQNAKRLKLISRVGIGLDSVDLLEAKKRGIHVSYTPDAPAPAVAELTIGLMFSLLRFVHVANLQLHRKEWYRHFGRRVSNVTIGIIGVGRIGRRVLNLVGNLGCQNLLVNDIAPDTKFGRELALRWVDKEMVYSNSDIISVHVPLTSLTRNMIASEQIRLMKADALLINTSRGGIVNELDLYHALRNGEIGGAAIDVFETEPYAGALTEIPQCLLTSHMGSMSVDCRTRMEIEATEEAIRFLCGNNLQSEVPLEEYEIQMVGR